MCRFSQNTTNAYMFSRLLHLKRMTSYCSEIWDLPVLQNTNGTFYQLQMSRETIKGRVEPIMRESLCGYSLYDEPDNVDFPNFLEVNQ